MLYRVLNWTVTVYLRQRTKPLEMFWTLMPFNSLVCGTQRLGRLIVELGMTSKSSQSLMILPLVRFQPGPLSVILDRIPA